MAKSFATLLLSSLSLGAQAQTPVFKDLILIKTNLIPSTERAPGLKPFYIDIFEVSATEARALIPAIAYSSGEKPTRMTSAQAVEICRLRGMRLPTKDEWMAAASNLGRNKVYTFPNDTPAASFNIRTGDSFPVFDPRIGMDAVGTMGMTGNRAEFVKNADGSIGMCGGEYETRTNEEIQLPRICEKPSNENSTARCVIDAAAITSNVTYSSRVTEAHKEFLKTAGTLHKDGPTFVPRFEDWLISPDAEADDDSIDGPPNPFEEF